MFKVYFDFTCPFSYDFRKWLDLADLGYDVEWRCYLRAQAKEARPNYRLFDHAEEHPSGLAALTAYYHLRTNHAEHADKFHRAVLEACHEQGLDIDDAGLLCKIAGAFGVDGDALGAAIADPKVVRDVAAEHEDAIMAHMVMDTPTLVGPDHESMYVRLGVPPEDEISARRVVKTVVDIALAEPSILQLRRT